LDGSGGGVSGKKIDTDITARQLRAAARAAWKLDAFLERCNDDKVLSLMGFDLDWLADQFNKAADDIDPITERSGTAAGG
jgi:hypothetical protein